MTTTATSPAEDPSSPQRPPHPWATASLFSRLFFLWPYKLLEIGLERPLTDLDLADCHKGDTSKANLEHLQNLLRKHPKTDLRTILLSDFFRRVWFVQPAIATTMIAKVVQALALGQLIESFEGTNDDAFMWATVVVVCAIVVLFEHHHVFYFTWRQAMHFRIACVAAIYDKALRLPFNTTSHDHHNNKKTTNATSETSTGKIMNLASNDVERFLFATLFISYLIWAPLQAIGIFAVGWWMLGEAFAVGMALLLGVFVPLQFWLSGRFGYFRSTIAAITDQRVTFVSQAIRGARVMKVSGYEERFLERIQQFRAKEIGQIKKANKLRAANETLFFVTNVVICLVIFVVHVYRGGELKPGDVFTVFTLVNVLQIELIKHVSIGVMANSECWVSVGRVQKFLKFPQHTPQETLSLENESNQDSENAILLSNVTCYWDDLGTRVEPAEKEETQEGAPNSDTAAPQPIRIKALDDVSLDIARGKLVSVIGPVGSGKSALVHALVGELPVAKGSIARNYKTLAYAAQDPWIMDGTVEENILLGLPMDKEWYEEVLHACSLLVDLAQLRDGDQTVVGDRGVQLSGGQRARIGLARALYRKSDVLVVDDPLSAVDARVGRHLFQHALMALGVEKRGQTIILVTHQHQYVSSSRCVLVLDGAITCVGSYDECVEASGGKLTAHAADTSVDDPAQPASIDPSVIIKPKQDEETEKENDEFRNEPRPVDDDKKADKNEHKEMNTQGLVKTETYWTYMTALGGIVVMMILFIIFVATQASVLVTIALFGRWAEEPSEMQDDLNVVLPVVGLCVMCIVLAILRAFLSFDRTVQASQRLHDAMAESVLRSKIEFFDTNPLGRVLNRFSADVGISDDQLPQTLFDFIVISFIVFGAVATTLATLPYALGVLPFLLWYFVKVRRVFVTSTRELKRLEGLARSPVFAMLSEALSGIDTIRANQATEYFVRKFQAAHDAHTRAFYGFLSSSRWVGFRMDSIIVMFLTAVSYLAVVVQRENWFDVDPAILGISISFLIYLAGVFQWCIRQSAEVVNQMVSVERVAAFGRLESEAPLHKAGDEALLLSGWPTAGAIDFDGVSVRYRETLPLTLREVSFKIPAGARVGIVGRTGSGKSTVVQTLFRLLEPERGRIVIDGVDVSKLGLHTLRTKISVIPQVPTLFSGCTIRENLDLFSLASDEAIDEVLRACHLEEVVNELPGRWNALVSEGGSNFSVGQRQLLCLARALLSKNKILVLDEATASVDRRTDQLLQQTLQETFSEGTILAVAHRLDTVIEYDYILVLGHGEVLEFGSPHELLQNPEGDFSRMVSDTGVSMSQSLRTSAQQAFEARTSSKAVQ